MLYVVGLEDEPELRVQVESHSRESAIRVLADQLYAVGEIVPGEPRRLWAELIDSHGVAIPPPLHRRLTCRAEVVSSVKLTEVEA